MMGKEEMRFTVLDVRDKLLFLLDVDRRRDLVPLI
jgi:hypothetical protein